MTTYKLQVKSYKFTNRKQTLHLHMDEKNLFNNNHMNHIWMRKTEILNWLKGIWTPTPKGMLSIVAQALLAPKNQLEKKFIH